LSELSAISSLRNVSELPPLRVTNRFAVVGSRAPAYEFVFAAKPVRGRLDGPYLRLAVSPRPLAALGWTPAEASIPEQSLLLLGRKPVYAFARLSGIYTAIETTLPRQAIVASLRALQAH
jgi:hypothetical protein